MTAIRSGAVTLRSFRPNEFDVLWRAVRSAEPTVAVGRVVMDELRERVASSGQMTDREILFAIEADERLVGSIQAYRDQLPIGVFGIGIDVFDPADRGKGVGREAVALLVSHLFAMEAARRIEAGTASDNAPMRRVLEHLGFVQEGILRRWYPSDDGEGTDCVMYGMTKNDWEYAKHTWTFLS
ncbi:MAG TPA: GNAT family protein [Actinomycetota bacterium]